MAPAVPSIEVTPNSRPDVSEHARSIKPVQTDATADGSVPEAQAEPGDLKNPEFHPPLIKRKGSTAGIQGVDPLTAHILQRTGTETPVNGATAVGGDGNGLGTGSRSSELQPKRGGGDNTIPLVPTKEKKKGVSFLSRFIGGGRKKGTHNGSEDDESLEGDLRTEGIDAHVFSQPIGHIPQYPPPPKYIRVRSHHKSRREFNNLFLAQELYREPIYEGDTGSSNRNSITTTSVTSLAIPRHKSGAIWAMQFSKDGKYLAAGGQDKLVRVWKVIGTQEERSAHEREEDAAGLASGGFYTEGAGMRLNAPVFRKEPVHEYTGHTADILDLSWSKNQFLLSSSMDKTVRLWHVSKKECLCCFQHSDFVTSIVFHPIDDRFFLAGSLDSKLRLWSIPDKNVAFWNEVPDLITAVAFTPDGRMAIAGCLSGLCLFYETEGLKYNTQVQVRSTLGRNAKGSKITGIETTYLPPDDPNGEVKILVTSNDSRVRIYNFRDKSLETKFKGYENTCSQIHATFSDDVKYIISGSEDRKVYIWNVSPEGGEKKAKRPMEYFEAHSGIVTVAMLAPVKTRLLLGASEDPIYDLCNPPPITLMSKSEEEELENSTASQAGTGSSTLPKVPEEPPTASARALHSDGNIIVTADYTGHIKVFRQDCAYLKRKNEQWETASTLTRKLGVGRRNSTNQRNSVSWRSSIASDISDGTSSMRSLGRRTPPSRLPDDGVKERSASPRTSVAAIGLSVGSSPRSARSRVPSLTSGTPVTGGSGSVNGHSRAGSIASTVASSIQDIQAYNQPKVRDYQSIGVHGGAFGGGGPSAVPSANNSVQDGYTSEDSAGGDHMSCPRCGSTKFLAKKSKETMSSSNEPPIGQTRLECAKCRTVVM